MKNSIISKVPEILKDAPFIAVQYKSDNNVYQDIIHYSEIEIPENLQIEVLQLYFMDADRNILGSIKQTSALTVLKQIKKMAKI
ncbi:hypothetical protein [Daejeonia sp. YH14]|uniref:hypothetical protein n=1 Tax=Daejeonia sp. YH14 TaxID=3439042 RepID=UPI003F4923CA